PVSSTDHRRPLFPLRMAWREVRGARRHLAYLVASIGLGVAAVVAVDSFADSLERTVARSAKALLGGDVEIRSNQPLSPEAAALVAHPGPDVVAVTRVRELVAMTQAPDGRSQIVELKAVDPAYPLYGRVVSDRNQPLSSLIGSGRVLVHASLLAKLGLAAGAHLR